MSYESLRERVCAANREISRTGLAILTWGNASEADREAGVFAIKPSGVRYEDLRPADIVIVSLETGEVVDGSLRPSSDTPTHWHLFRQFASLGGIVHTHSTHATCWAQAKRPIPCLGTTHADAFHGPVPCTRELTPEEIETAYELNTGRVIAGHFADHGLEPLHVPGVLVASHGPFVWGKTAAKAVEVGITLEEIARMAWLTLELAPGLPEAAPHLREKHFERKHGKNAYYGQG